MVLKHMVRDHIVLDDKSSPKTQKSSLEWFDEITCIVFLTIHWVGFAINPSFRLTIAYIYLSLIFSIVIVRTSILSCFLTLGGAFTVESTPLVGLIVSDPTAKRFTIIHVIGCGCIVKCSYVHEILFFAKPLKISSMARWKVAGALCNPKGIPLNSKRPNWVTKTVRFLSFLLSLFANNQK